MEELAKFTFKEYIVDPKNTYNLELPKCYVKLQLYVKSIKNFLAINDQPSYSNCLKGLAPELQSEGFTAFEVRVFLYNMTRDD